MPGVASATAPGGLLVGDPDARGYVLLGGFEGEGVGGGGCRKMMDVTGELGSGYGGFYLGEIKGKCALTPGGRHFVGFWTASR